MIELLVVLLIIGILAAVAAPMYLRHVERAKASEAVAVLSTMRQAEREYYSKHKVYLAVATGNLPNDPEASSNPGLDIIVGPSQYFSLESYSVAVGNQPFTGGFVNATAAEDFLITADGSASVTAAGKARNSADVVNYRLEMDNSGTTVYSTDATTYKLY